MALYTDQFSSNHDTPGNAPPTKTLVIASTGRSGSHMLGHALHRTGAFGYPLEYANPTNFTEWERRFDTSGVEDTLHEIQNRRTAPNGVFGIKLHYSHVRHHGGIRRIERLLPNAHYVILTRKDLVRQAVSLAVARQTGVWISGMEARNSNPTYDFDQINHCLRELVLDNASWRYTLEAAALPYIEVSFDEVKNDLVDVVGRIAKFAGIDVDASSLTNEHATKKQGNELNDSWVNRFLDEYEEDQLITRSGNGDVMRALETELEAKQGKLAAVKQQLAEAKRLNAELKPARKQLDKIERSVEKALRHPIRRWFLPKSLRQTGPANPTK
ncbi:Stf0 family sulfotransferase [Sulfuriroseicoccus oceanibius]|uniref:Sulphotransferase Stf0 domain-containing protein n=1 Tax=Sulfuriroseicoccus oceanibius TaxID=2707525 RepID=A0A6B3LFJ7_9BACT|nr:Stf0 family sulfotransferase [Sulfuriroseicoccus oceanibius]QQL45467.1 hypothetical protein G3M56_002420 [Sulfuriroseicoccus oceanibius]